MMPYAQCLEDRASCVIHVHGSVTHRHGLPYRGAAAGMQTPYNGLRSLPAILAYFEGFGTC